MGLHGLLQGLLYVTLISQARGFAILLMIIKIKQKSEAGIISNGVLLIQLFVKIGHFFQN
jgi:hypothetical protein